MNILIFEYITGGGMVGQALPATLVKEGEVMLNAIVCDLLDISDVQVSTLRDYRLQACGQDMVEHVVTEDSNYTNIIDSVAEKIDALLIIAPESDGLLATLCNEYSGRDFLLLNSSTESVELTSDKLKTFAYLNKFNIAQIPTYEINNVKCIESEKIIVKPIDGVGCENIYLINNKSSISELLGSAEIYNYIVQPYIKGKSASLCLLCWDGKCRILSANVQNIKINSECLGLQGCNVNALDRDDFKRFSADLIKTVPGLRGYVGVDIVITEDEIMLVEINPRLTTSYAGLRSACGINVADLILKTFVNQGLPEFSIIDNSSVVINIGAEYAA
ncbi:MAG: ATP-grasp domain-containing protein [Gammaproteobacteria bacterium]